MSADEQEQEPVLAADDIVAGYVPGVDVLRGCSIEVRPGEVVGVIGPNGAGKSTLVKAVFGLLRVRGGTVHLRGEEVTNRPAHELVRRGVGYVPQLQNVFPALTVEENLRMGVYLRPKAYARRATAVEELFPLLADRRGQKAGAMSGGERQMLAMARALMMEPQLLLLDEPSAGLSPLHQDHVFDRCRMINSAGVAVLMVEQNARRCLQICDRGYVLDQGRNAHTGTGTALLHDEKVIELYLGTLARVR
ncbi:ABC transporter ATP-binding protein [Streptomyces resistomycificus]|uniref:Branched-chain amino acid ABC transporter ATP-binding protein n=1 Tax=Streptomyces resistomycificus TaxID=67356 RepID=A0A0L8KXL6_9ACTN|nr:ABC transporter ATP-binding protein [Streptomyces resistomycificus]KOG30632.1 branched-chain amino acid ABC transporter ATP-binding protein [Streptomyces resistomycificus]KUO02253.1 ABC transporter ATP-binding protein [Streptomyces resistomycificus]